MVLRCSCNSRLLKDFKYMDLWNFGTLSVFIFLGLHCIPAGDFFPSGERTKVRTWRHDSLGWTHDGMDMNARWSGHERTKVCSWTPKHFSCFHVQTTARSAYFRAFLSRLSCFHVQTLVRSSVFPNRVTLNARRPPPPPVRSFQPGYTDFRPGSPASFLNLITNKLIKERYNGKIDRRQIPMPGLFRWQR